MSRDQKIVFGALLCISGIVLWAVFDRALIGGLVFLGGLLVQMD